MPYPSQELAIALEAQGLVTSYAVHDRLFPVGVERTWVTIYPAPQHEEEVAAALRGAGVPFLDVHEFIAGGVAQRTKYHCPLQ